LPIHFHLRINYIQLLGGDVVDKNVIDGSYTRYRMPTEEDLVNGNIQKEAPDESNKKSSISESYGIKHNTVK